MILSIQGSHYKFTSLVEFREQYELPNTFAVSNWQPKDATGMGSIDRAATDLHAVRERVLAAVPKAVPATDWLRQTVALAAVFEAELRAINPNVGLREPEIAFAVNGFGDVCSAYAFALARAAITQGSAPAFEAVYREWLWGTVHIGGTAYAYHYRGAAWTVRLVHHAYGRVGLIVETPQGTHHVMDKALACPAEGYMAGLLTAVAAKMAENTVT